MNNFDYKNLSPFKWYVLENFPFIEANFDALTDWQLFCKLGKEINKIINNTNILGTQIENLTTYVSNYFDNLNIQEEVNNKLNEMAENGELQEIISAYLNISSLLCFNTVNDLKLANNLINGSFVKTLGYYEKNDGGSNIYYIKNAENTDIIDEGSIIALNNNLNAVMVKSNYVTYKQFGAKLDGISDDTNYIINCHNFANLNNLKVIQNNGILYIPSSNSGNCPIINTSCDFTGMKIKFDVNSDGKIPFIIADNNTLFNNTDIQNITLTTEQISLLKQNSNDVIDFLKNYKNNYVYFTTDMSFGQRRNTDEIIYYKQGFLVDDYGSLAPNNMYADISENATNVIMRYLPISQKEITIKFGEIEITGNTNYNPRILILRNNVTLKNGYINKVNYDNTTTWNNSLFDIRYSYNVTIENFKGNTPTAETSGTDILNYCFLFIGCYNINFINNKLLKGHGAFTSHYCSFINFINNTINRFDNHYGLYGNINIENSNIIGYPGRINLGYGNAIVNINSCYFQKFNENQKTWLDSIIHCRQDVLVLFSGNINVNNCKIVGRDIQNNNNFITLLQWSPGSTYTGSVFPEWANYNMPIINIDKTDYSVENISFRVFNLRNNNNHEYQLNNITVKLNHNTNQSNSLVAFRHWVNTSNAKITLENCLSEIEYADAGLTMNLYNGSKVVSNSGNVAINNFGNATINGTFGSIKNFGNLTSESNTNITILNNTGFLILNNTTVREIYASGNIEINNNLTISQSGVFYGVYLTGGNIINVTACRFHGSYINFGTFTNANATLILTGSSMPTAKAGSLQNNGTVVGNGNYAGSNSSIINTL